MNKTAIQIKMIALWTVILLFTACQDDVPFRNADRIQEGIPTTVKLGFQASEATVETRAAQDQKYEDRVDNVFILIFDEEGNIHDRFFCKSGSGLSYDDGNDLKSSGILTFTTTSLNNATIVGIANLADGNTSTAYTVTEAELTAVTTLDELKAKMMIMRDESVYRSAYFMMTGYAKVIDPAEGADPTLINIPALESGQTATLECTLELERTDAKVMLWSLQKFRKVKTGQISLFSPQAGWLNGYPGSLLFYRKMQPMRRVTGILTVPVPSILIRRPMNLKRSPEMEPCIKAGALFFTCLRTERNVNKKLLGENMHCGIKGKIPLLMRMGM